MSDVFNPVFVPPLPSHGWLMRWRRSWAPCGRLSWRRKNRLNGSRRCKIDFYFGKFSPLILGRNTMTMTIDLSLKNRDVYCGCEIEDVGGRLNLLTAPDQAAGILGRNLQTLVDATPPAERGSVTLTGPMAVWAYLTAFHCVLHSFREVRYADGKGTDFVVAAHGRP